MPRLVNEALAAKANAYRAQRARMKRRAIDGELRMIDIIAKSLENFGRQPTNKQIADIMGISVSTVSKYKSRIRTRLANRPCPLCGSFIDSGKI